MEGSLPLHAVLELQPVLLIVRIQWWYAHVHLHCYIVKMHLFLCFFVVYLQPNLVATVCYILLGISCYGDEAVQCH